MSVVLETQQNNNYEPSESEIIEYGKWLGMNLPEDNPFLWIAREGLKAPLPEHWKACKSEKGELYYFNFKTGESIWDHPMDEHFKELFKSEKQNPTPQSIAQGAKRKDDGTKHREDSTRRKDEGVSSSKKSKKKHSRDETQDAMVDSLGKRETSVPKNRVQPLKSLKMKKELPDELRISYDADEKKRTVAIALEAADLQPVLSQSRSSPDSPAVSIPTTLPGDSAITSIPGTTSSTAKEEVIAGGGVNGLKALSKLSTPTGAAARKLSPVDSSEHEEAQERAAQKKKKIAVLEKISAEVDAELRTEKERLRGEMEAALSEYQTSLDGEKAAALNASRAKFEETLRTEQQRLEKEMQASVKQVKSEFASQRASELQAVRETQQQKMEYEKRKIEQEVASLLETFVRERKQEAELKREAQSQALRELDRSTNDVKEFGNCFAREYEQQYDWFCKTIRNSQSDFALRNIQQKEQMQSEFEIHLAVLKDENATILEKEKLRLHGDLEDLRRDYQNKADTVKRENESILQEMTETLRRQKEETERIQFSRETEKMTQSMEDLREKQQKEVEDLKRELKQKAAEEIKFALEELAKEQKAQLAMSLASIPPSAANNEHATESKVNLPSEEEYFAKEIQVSPSMSGKRVGSSSPPPSLDGQLLVARPVSDTMAAAATRFIEPTTTPVHTAQQPQQDIKTVITEALREVFAGSPFTLPSPGAPASRTESPAMNRMSSKRPSESLSVEGSSRTYTVSFQDQHALVEEERQRVREGRSFVASQRRKLEGRRHQLKQTRHQWKQDVLIAKQEGVRSSSKRGQLLNKVRLALEEQAQSLENDEAILRDSEMWLLTKEQRLMQLEQQIAEQEQMRGDSSLGAGVYNFDASALTTGFFKPPYQHRRSQVHPSTANFIPLDSSASSPVLAKTLNRIEKRLDEVTSIINMQQQQMGSLVSPSRYNTATSPGASSSGAFAQSQSRRRSSRSQSKAEMRGDVMHMDPWQT